MDLYFYQTESHASTSFHMYKNKETTTRLHVIGHRSALSSSSFLGL